MPRWPGVEPTRVTRPDHTKNRRPRASGFVDWPRKVEAPRLYSARQRTFRPRAHLKSEKRALRPPTRGDDMRITMAAAALPPVACG